MQQDVVAKVGNMLGNIYDVPMKSSGGVSYPTTKIGGHPVAGGSTRLTGKAQEQLKSIEAKCGKKYSDNLSEGDHDRYQCLTAFAYYCDGSQQAKKALNVSCNTIQQNGKHNLCPVCSW